MKLTSISRPLAVSASAVAVLIGGTALVAWNLGRWHIMTTGPDEVPMAPPTALGFVLLGGALAARLIKPTARAAQTAATLAAGLVALLGSALLLQVWLGFPLPWDNWLVGAPQLRGTNPIGRMSPLTALTFILSSGALLLHGPPSPDRAFFRRVARGAAALALLIGAEVTLGYASGTPLLFDAGVVPMALWTGLAFVTLDLGILVALLTGGVATVTAEPPAPLTVAEANRRFARQLVAGGLAIASVLAFGGFFYLRSSLTAARDAAGRQLEAIAALQVAQITAWRNERLAEAHFLMRTADVVHDTAAFVARPGDAAARQELLDWLEPIRGDRRYESVLVWDATGRLLLRLPESTDDTALPPAAVARALTANEPEFTDLRRDVTRDTALLDIIVPIRPLGREGPPGPPLALIALRLNARHTLFPLVQGWPIPSATAESNLVQREGHEVVYLNPVRHLTVAPLALRRPLDTPTLSSARAARGEFGLHRGIDYRGVPVLSVLRPIPATPWSLVAELDEVEVRAAIRRDIWQTGALGVLGIFTLGLAGTVLWRQRHANLLRRTLEGEQQRLALVERLALLTQYANDIILLLTRDGRILEANDRALSAYGYTLAELRALPAGALRPADQAAQLTAQFDHLHPSAGSVYETIHLRKDGSTLPVEVSGRSVLIAGEPHILAICRDITERKTHEARARAHEIEIARLNRLYFVISQINQVLVRTKSRTELFAAVCRVLVERGGFRLAWIGEWDAAAARLSAVASAGATAGIVDQGEISPAAALAAHAALRENRPQVGHDLFADAAAPAAPTGLPSCLTLPLRIAGHPCGVLAVCASEQSFFAPREIELLEETAGDVSFALEVFAGETQRRATEAALREGEERFRALFESSIDGFLLTEPNGEIFAVNSAACALLRRPAAEICRLGRAGLIDPADPRIPPLLDERRRLGKARGEIRLLRGDGSTVEVEISSAVFQPGPNTRAGIVIRDITARIRAERELRQSLVELRTLNAVSATVQQSDMPVAGLLASVATLLPSALSRPGDAQAVIVLDGHVFRAGEEGAWLEQTSGPIVINSRPAGTVTVGYVRPAASPGESAGLTEHERETVAGVARTLGVGLGEREALAAVQRLNAELEGKVTRRTAELAARHREMQALLESVPDLVVRLRRDGTVLNFQPAKTATPLAALRLPLDPQAPAPTTRALHVALLNTGQRALATGCTVTSEAELPATPAAITVDLRVAPIGTEEFVGFVRDITARKQIEAGLAATLEKEREISEMKSRFISVTSHEFRTPMAAAMGAVEILAHHLEQLAPAKRQDLFGRITTALHHMTAMLDELLLLSRLEAGRLPATPTVINLRHYAQSIVEEIELGDRGTHRFVFTATGGPEDFPTDIHLMRHILSNLLSNAARYSPAGTTIALTLTLEPARAVLAVEDEGIGIPAADRTRIFAPFERGSNVGTIKGTGLGLNIVQRMTTMLGGTITIDADRPRGSRFVLTLPRPS